MVKKPVSKNKARSKSSSRKRTKRRVSYKKRKLNKPTKKTRKKTRTKRVIKGGSLLLLMGNEKQTYPITTESSRYKFETNCITCYSNKQINGIKTTRSNYVYTYSKKCKKCDKYVYCFIDDDNETEEKPKTDFVKKKCYLLSGNECKNCLVEQKTSAIVIYHPLYEFNLTIKNYETVKKVTFLEFPFLELQKRVYKKMKLIKIKNNTFFKTNINKKDLGRMLFQKELLNPHGVLCIKCFFNPKQINDIETTSTKYNYTYSENCKNCDEYIYCFIEYNIFNQEYIEKPATNSITKVVTKPGDTETQCYLLSRKGYSSGEMEDGVITTYNPLHEFKLTINNYETVKKTTFSTADSKKKFMDLIKIKKENILKTELNNIPLQQILTYK